ncbi:MAG: ABC transporter permease subunit [Oscillospiraceae bacterium]
MYLTWLFVLVLWVFIYKTPYGFWLRASGEKPETLRTAGIEPEKMKWLASILCGVLCALAGATCRSATSTAPLPKICPTPAATSPLPA